MNTYLILQDLAPELFGVAGDDSLMDEADDDVLFGAISIAVNGSKWRMKA